MAPPCMAPPKHGSPHPPAWTHLPLSPRATPQNFVKRLRFVSKREPALFVKKKKIFDALNLGGSYKYAEEAAMAQKSVFEHLLEQLVKLYDTPRRKVLATLAGGSAAASSSGAGSAASSSTGQPDCEDTRGTGSGKAPAAAASSSSAPAGSVRPGPSSAPAPPAAPLDDYLLGTEGVYDVSRRNIE
eukprot:7389448-Prymnesium_polylepis.1